MTQTLTPEHWDLMRVPLRYRGASVDRIHESIRPAIEAFIAKLPAHLEAGTGLLLWGRYGAGKTCASICVAAAVKKLRDRVLSRSVLWCDVADLINAKFDRVEWDDCLLWDRARTVDLLVLDDLGREHAAQSGHAQGLVENLLRERAREMRSTIVNTNLDLDELAKRYGDGLLERAEEVMRIVHANGPSLRKSPVEPR